MASAIAASTRKFTMTRKSTRRLAVAIVAIMSSLIAPAIGPAAAASADPVYSQNVGVAHYERYSKYKVTGWECDVTGTWSTAENGYNFLQGSYSCQTGHAQGDTYVGMRVDPAQLTGSVDCGSTVIRSEVNIDEAGERAGTYGPTYVGENCGSLTQLCFTQGTGDERCVAFTVGAPPPLPETPAPIGTGCDRGNVTAIELGPAVTEPYPGSTWQNRARRTLKVTWSPGTLSGTIRPYLILSRPYPSGFVGMTGSYPSQWFATATSTVTGNVVEAVSQEYFASTGSTGVLSFEFSSNGTGGSGSPGTFPTVLGVGVTYGVQSGSRAGFIADNAPPTTPVPYDGATYGHYGYTNGAACNWYWGAKIVETAGDSYDEPVQGTIPEPESEPLPPPSVYIGPSADCPEGTTLCVEQNPVDPPPNSVPDPESESCDFSITDPATWGGQVICALVWAAKAIMGLIGDVLDFLEGLLGAVGNLLKALFIPDPTSWGIDGLMDQVNGRAPFSLFAAIGAAMGDLGTAYGGAGSCGSFGQFEGAEVSACDASAVPGFSALRLLVGGGLVAMTGWYIFGILASLVRQE